MAAPQPKRITELDLANPLTDADLIAVVQANRTKKARMSSVKQLIDTSCQCTLVSRYNTVGSLALPISTLQSYVMPDLTLPTNASWLSIYAAGGFAHNGNSKAIKLNITTPSGLDMDFPLPSAPYFNDGVNDAFWEMRIKIQRSSEITATVTSLFTLHDDSGSASNPTTYFTITSPLNNIDFGNTIQFNLIAEGSAANDVTVTPFIIEAHLMDANS